MAKYLKLVQELCTEKLENIFEIGANYGQDAEYLRQGLRLTPKDVFCFEPHPQIFKELKSLYGFNCFELAISNTNGYAKFNAIDIGKSPNSGISSLRNSLIVGKEKFTTVEVKMTRMDDFLIDNNIPSIGFLKLDVEGTNYEVLEGFGNKLKDVKVIQTEAEYKPYWEGQRDYGDIEKLLQNTGFKLVWFRLDSGGVQSDSLWIHSKFLKQII